MMVVWQVLMVTSNRVLQLGSGLGTGSWTVEWELQFDKIQGPPSVLQVRNNQSFGSGKKLRIRILPKNNILDPDPDSA